MERDAALYWEMRARELQDRLDIARDRLLALADALPPETLELLEMDAATLAAASWAESPVLGLENTHVFMPSDVETELKIAWRRLGRGGNG
jgi:hypothetical protein